MIQATFKYYENGRYQDCVRLYPDMQRAVYELQRLIAWWGSRLTLGEIKALPDEEA